MTPTATTPAGRDSRSKPRQGPTSRNAGVPRSDAPTRHAAHRSPLTRPTAPPSPRRISGPVRPKRQPAGRPGPRSAPPVVRAPLARRSVAYVRAVPDHALLDRIVRGRAWIPLLGVLLVGIVAMQVEVLKLNASIGRSLDQATSLQTRNEALRTAVARAADDQRIESRAAGMGMIMPAPAAVQFLVKHPTASVATAVAAIRQPDATNFQAALTAAVGTSSTSN